ncbi:MAG: adenylate/guanylate cyclase domain-containing protein [Panacagrimonas sp.]
MSEVSQQVADDSASRLGAKTVWLHVRGISAAMLVTVVLALIGLELDWRQAGLLLLLTPVAISVFLVPELIQMWQRFAPLRHCIGLLDRGQTLEPQQARAAMVRTLNLPIHNFARISFVHGPLGAIAGVAAIWAANQWFAADMHGWQMLLFALMILLFAAPAHAIVEFFGLSSRLEPVVKRLWPHCQHRLDCEDESLINVTLQAKLLYLCIFITALPLVFIAVSALLKLDVMLQQQGVEQTRVIMHPLGLWIGLVTLLSLGGGIAMSVLTAKAVTRSAQRLIEGMNDVERGHLAAVDLEISSTDEYAQLYRGFNMMVDSLREEVRMLEITQDLATELHLDALIARILRAAADLLDADRATLFVHDPETGELWSRYADGMETREIRFKEDFGIAGAVFSTGKTENISDPYADPRFNPDVDKRTGYRTHSILCMPIVNKTGTRIGVTQVLNKNGGKFHQRDEQRLRAFTSQIAVTLDNARLFDEVLAIKNYNENILSSTSNGVITLDNQQRVVTANDAALAMLGIQAASVVGISAEGVFGNENHWVVDCVEKVMTDAESHSVVDADLQRPDQSSASVNLTATPMHDAQNQTIGSVLTFEDFTREKRVKATMSRYMSKEVAEQLLEAGESVLGGRLQKVSILFSDLRGFTSISESLGARETVSVLNDYFEHMVEVIFEHQGILDKYIGDAIMALFGSPFVGEQDADNAVATATGMIKALALLNADRKAQGAEPMQMGIGIGTGDVVVGNIGSHRRMEYTVIGDSVNLAARLESATKQYGLQILISEATLASMTDPVRVREIDRIRVKGKDQAVAVFEPLDHHDDNSFPHMEECLVWYQAGLDACRRREWPQAVTAFEEVLQLNPDDRPSQIHLERSAYYSDHPPAPHWDGVWTLKEK